MPNKTHPIPFWVEGRNDCSVMFATPEVRWKNPVGQSFETCYHCEKKYPELERNKHFSSCMVLHAQLSLGLVLPPPPFYRPYARLIDSELENPS